VLITCRPHILVDWGRYSSDWRKTLLATFLGDSIKDDTHYARIEKAMTEIRCGVFTFILQVNLVVFSGVFVYTIAWTVMAIRAGTWKDTKQRVVTRTDNPRMFWSGVGSMLAVGATLCGAAALLVVLQRLILEFLGVPI